MGFQMAGNVRKKMLSTATLHIFDVNPTACDQFIEQFWSYGPIKVGSSSKEVAQFSATIISMVPMDKHARAVYLDDKDGVIGAEPNKRRLFLECSTIDVATTKEIGEKIMKAAVGTYVDTPVSGGVKGAALATLSFFCGCSNDESLPVTQCVKQVTGWMGSTDRINFCDQLGGGLVAKIVNNYIGLCNMVVAAEGMAFGIRHGIDKEVLWKCVRGSSGDSWVMENALPVPGILPHAPSSNGFKAGFTPPLCAKDVGLAIRAAQQVGIDATMGEQALKLWQKAAQDSRTAVSSFILLPSILGCHLDSHG